MNDKLYTRLTSLINATEHIADFCFTHKIKFPANIIKCYEKSTAIAIDLIDPDKYFQELLQFRDKLKEMHELLDSNRREDLKYISTSKLLLETFKDFKSIEPTKELYQCYHDIVMWFQERFIFDCDGQHWWDVMAKVKAYIDPICICPDLKCSS